MHTRVTYCLPGEGVGNLEEGGGIWEWSLKDWEGTSEGVESGVKGRIREKIASCILKGRGREDGRQSEVGGLEKIC